MSRWKMGCLLSLLATAGTLPAQERTVYRENPDYWSQRAVEFCDALASGDMQRVLRFQPGGGKDMPKEARSEFQSIVEGFEAFFATPAGKFHRKVFAAFPKVSSLPADLEWIELEEQLRITDPDAATFLHALSFKLRFLWDQDTKAWVVESFHVEFESVDTASGITAPERDLVGASLTAVLSGFAAGAEEASVLETARSKYAASIFERAKLERVAGTGSGPLTLSLARAVKARDLAALLARLDVASERFEGKKDVFATQLEAFPDLEEQLTAFPVLSDVATDVHRAAVRYGAPSSEGAVEIVRSPGGFSIALLTLAPAGAREFRLPALLHRL